MQDFALVRLTVKFRSGGNMEETGSKSFEVKRPKKTFMVDYVRTDLFCFKSFHLVESSLSAQCPTFHYCRP